MDLVTIATASPYDDRKLVADAFLDGDQANVRLIRMSPGQQLPAHTHGRSELMLYVVEGAATLETDEGPVAFSAGSLACYRQGEELRVRNDGPIGVTLLAFLTPPFPPAETNR
ncbi:MAG: cupin [Acidimicrobiales bacterium]|nr:cupin [Acidimicrobiales bacterium]